MYYCTMYDDVAASPRMWIPTEPTLTQTGLADKPKELRHSRLCRTYNETWLEISAAGFQ